MTTVDDILEHFGTKGMKWGVRKDRGHEGEQAKTKTIAKLDKKFARADSVGTFIKIHNRAADLTNKNDVARINNKPEYKHADFTRKSPLRDQYYAEHQRAYLDNVHKAARELGTNASGTKQYGIMEHDDGGWGVYLADVKHADGREILFTVRPAYDAKGRIIRIDSGSEMAQSDDPVAAFLEHFGVKGMKWGVRRTRNASGKLEPAEVHLNPIGQVHTVTGGTNHPTSEDAKRALALRQVAKASGTHALSNDEMRDLLNRMNLEENYGRLTESQSGRAKIRKGHTAVKEIVAVGKTVAEINSLAKKAQGKG